jgi:hypothetical protein
MGLDTSHDCWHGSYGSFMRWRIEIAKCIGIPLQLMDGYFKWTEISFDDLEKLKPMFNWDGSYPSWAVDLHLAVVGAPLPLKWEFFAPSPLHILLNHSDCEGSIRWQDCDAIADALEAIIPLLPKDKAGGHIGDWKDKTQRFVDGLRLAWKNKEDVEFH